MTKTNQIYAKQRDAKQKIRLESYSKKINNNISSQIKNLAPETSQTQSIPANLTKMSSQTFMCHSIVPIWVSYCQMTA